MMDGGIFLGKYSPSSMTKVPTFCINSNSRDYYYCTLSHLRYSKAKAVKEEHGNGMYPAAPVILAFWSDEE